MDVVWMWMVVVQHEWLPGKATGRWKQLTAVNLSNVHLSG